MYIGLVPLFFWQAHILCSFGSNSPHPNYLDNSYSEKDPTKLENARLVSFEPYHNKTCLLGL